MFEKLTTDRLSLFSLTSPQIFQVILSRYLSICEGRAPPEFLGELNPWCQQLMSDERYLDENTSQMVALSENLSEKTLSHFGSSLLAATPLFSDDENVLFFLLKNSCRVDHFHGKGFTEKLLHSMYPGGTDALLRYLTNRFQERGFTKLLPVITHKLTILDPSLPCRLSKNKPLN